MKGAARGFASVLIMVLFSLTACLSASSEEIVRSQSETLSVHEAIGELVFEHIGASASATGVCNSTWLDRWYGSEESFETIEEAYQDVIAADEWAIWPEDVTPIWRLENEDGLFSFVLVEVTRTNNPEREDYSLSADTVQRLTEYPTAYLVRLGYMTNAQTRRCFGE